MGGTGKGFSAPDLTLMANRPLLVTQHLVTQTLPLQKGPESKKSTQTTERKSNSDCCVFLMIRAVLIYPSILGPGRDTNSDKASPTTVNPLLLLLNFISYSLPFPWDPHTIGCSEGTCLPFPYPSSTTAGIRCCS